MAFEPLLQRRIMGRFATGVTLITTYADGESWGMTANGILSLSLDPPLVLVSVDRRNQMHASLMHNGCFAINVLGSQHEAISRRFAARGPKDFSDIHLTVAVTGSPILVDALAYVDCRIVEVVAGGDHDMFVGEPVAGDTCEGQPLIFYAGHYARLTPLPSPVAMTPLLLEDSYALYGAF